MYCPKCGNKLELIIRNSEDNHIDYEKDPNNSWVDYDESDWYYCSTNNCFTENNPLIHHGSPAQIYKYSKEALRRAPEKNCWSLTKG